MLSERVTKIKHTFTFIRTRKSFSLNPEDSRVLSSARTSPKVTCQWAQVAENYGELPE